MAYAPAKNANVSRISNDVEFGLLVNRQLIYRKILNLYLKSYGTIFNPRLFQSHITRVTTR